MFRRGPGPGLLNRVRFTIEATWCRRAQDRGWGDEDTHPPIARGGGVAPHTRRTAECPRAAEQSQLLAGSLGTSPFPEDKERRGRGWRLVRRWAREMGQGPFYCPSCPLCL